MRVCVCERVCVFEMLVSMKWERHTEANIKNEELITKCFHLFENASSLHFVSHSSVFC